MPATDRRSRLSAGILLFTAAGALVPGWLLLRDPSGAGLGLRPDWLAGSPLADYRLPGLLLFGVIGLGGLLAGAARLARRSWAPLASGLMGLFLVGWIGVQWRWLQPHSWLQPLIFVLGSVLMGLAMADRQAARRRNR